ncbi:MAG: hypothetical protein KDA57_08770 [Planctomycetales bacterium]|nr:hypothetical protein [Planctomycetales bacterium]
MNSSMTVLSRHIELVLAAIRGGLIVAVAMSAGCSQSDAPSTTPASTPTTLDERRTSGATEMDNDITFVDDYLTKWDRFAQGENNFVPEIKQSTAEFELALTRLLASRDPRAPSRLVFYAVVQVGGFIVADSELGRAAKPVLGDDFNIFTNKEGKDTFFAGDLYFWWQDHKNEYKAFRLFEEWQNRDFAKSTAIPMYEAIRQKQ